MATEYEKAYTKYRELHDKGANGDLQARKDKLKAAEEYRAIERDGARNGVILESGKQVGTAPTKRSLQEAYVRTFQQAAGPGEKEPVVVIDGKQTTLSEYHSKRLLGK